MEPSGETDGEANARNGVHACVRDLPKSEFLKDLVVAHVGIAIGARAFCLFLRRDIQVLIGGDRRMGCARQDPDEDRKNKGGETSEPERA